MFIVFWRIALTMINFSVMGGVQTMLVLVLDRRGSHETFLYGYRSLVFRA